MLEKEIAQSLECLKNGGVLLYPTDTVWGLGCSAENEKAIQKIYDIKKRPNSKSLIILVESVERLQKYVGELPDNFLETINQTNYPTTVVYPNAQNLPKILIAEDGSIAIRLLKHPFCEPLISQLNAPLISTSANISGKPSPQSFEAISPNIKGKMDYIVNRNLFPTTEVKKSSRIVKLMEKGELTILRE